jgi:GT2 family glycosyltransferase
MSEKIGIVTVLYNSETVLEMFYDSLINQTYKDLILYIVDNNSPDNSLQKSKDLFSNCWFKVVFIENEDNYGVAKEIILVLVPP